MIFSKINEREYNVLMELLSCADGPDEGDDVTGNSRMIRFMDTRDDYGKKGFLDPWGEKVKIFIDTNYDGKLLVGGKELAGTVFVYSNGPNKRDDNGQQDDVCSWK